MTHIEELAGAPADAGEPEDLTVRVARDLLERARAEGVSLVGPGWWKRRAISRNRRWAGRIWSLPTFASRNLTWSGSSRRTACCRPCWQDRVVHFEGKATDPGRGWCLEAPPLRAHLRPRGLDAKTYETISLRRHCPGQVLEVAVTSAISLSAVPPGLSPEISPRSCPWSGSLARPAGMTSVPTAAVAQPGPKVLFPRAPRHNGRRVRRGCRTLER